MTLSYALIERKTGNVIDEFGDEPTALGYVLSEMTSSDLWGLFEFGPGPDDGRFIGAGLDLQALANGLVLMPEAVSAGGHSAGLLRLSQLTATAALAAACIVASVGIAKLDPRKETLTTGGATKVLVDPVETSS